MISDTLSTSKVTPEHKERQKNVRLLLITSDISVLDSGSVAHRKILDLESHFHEVHVLVIARGHAQHKEQVIRPLDTVWFYIINAISLIHGTRSFVKTLEAQLVFNGELRVDCVVAENFGVAGLAGWYIKKKYNRPLQLHVYEDFWDPEVIHSHEHSIAYRIVTRFLLDQVECIRVRSEAQRQALETYEARFASSAKLLPHFYDLSHWRDQKITVDVKVKYPQFNFIIVHVTSMRSATHSDAVLFAVAPILRQYPMVGLVIIGDGPLRGKLERQILSLGIQRQVEFVPSSCDVVSYIKTAQTVIHVSDDANEDDVMLATAVSRVPLIANTHSLAGELFKNGESAHLCDPEDTACITRGIQLYMSGTQSRSQYAINACDAVFDKVIQDYKTYLLAYVESITECLTENTLKNNK
jgi:glycosyltransferase involved in cell wall biosynthesis